MLDDMLKKAAQHKLTHRSWIDKMSSRMTEKHWRKIGAIRKLPGGREEIDMVVVTADNMKMNMIMYGACIAAAVIGSKFGHEKS